MILGKRNATHMLTKYFAGSKFSGISRAPGFCVEGGMTNIVEASCCVLGAGGSQPRLGGAAGQC